jgi:hypothetical protein
LPASDGYLKVKGNRFSYRFNCQAVDHLTMVMGTLHLTVPAILGLALTDSVTSYSTSAVVGTAKFGWEHRAAAQPFIVATSEGLEAGLDKVFTHFDLMFESTNRRVLAAAHYVHVASRLQEVGTSKWEYMAEVILNYSKALEALFGGRRDGVRRHLKALGYSNREIEGVFIPLSLLRSSLDVAHARLTGFRSTDLEGIYTYLDGIDKPMKDLVWRVLEAVAAGEYHLQPIRNRVLSAKERKAIQRVVASTQAASPP